MYGLVKILQNNVLTISQVASEESPLHQLIPQVFFKVLRVKQNVRVRSHRGWCGPQ